jgi:hypothetical protein
MILWVWDACGPGHCGGVTDNDARARQAAEACITSGQASTAKVEGARLAIGPALTSVYARTGHGWTARRRDNRITWTPFTADLAAS